MVQLVSTYTSGLLQVLEMRFLFFATKISVLFCLKAYGHLFNSSPAPYIAMFNDNQYGNKLTRLRLKY